MRFLLAIGFILMATYPVVGQTNAEFDAEKLERLDSESLYEESQVGCRNLENSPQVRLQFVDVALERAKDEENFEKASDFAANGAVVYTELGLNRDALRYGQEALKFARQTPSKKDDIWSLFRLAEIRSILQNPTQALLDSREALRLSIACDSLVEVGWSYNEMGEIHRRISNYDSALHFYNLGLQAFEKKGFARGIQYAHQNLGMTYAANLDYDKSLEEFSIASEVGRIPDVLYWLEQGDAMIKIIQHKISVDSAISFGIEMMVLAEKGNFPRWEMRFKSNLAELYRQKGEWDLFWQYHLEADSLEEIQTGERIRMQTNVSDHQYRMQLLRAEQELESEQNQNRLLIWISVVIALGLLGIVALIQVTKNKRIRKINERLFRQNDDLDEMIKEKDIWIHLMAHDLKSPLNAISGLLEMLKDDSLPPPVKEKVLANITKSVDKGSELISQLLEISMLESSDVKTDIRATNINELVKDTEKIFKPSAEQKGISLHSELPDAAINLETDPVHAQRILENFVSNALKFSPAGKNIQLVLESQNDHVAIHVIDEGPGMSTEDQKNLFQKFKRLSAQPTGGESSTGLGLSIVKQLADRIDARILVKSKPGEGATFTLSMPRKDAS